MGSLSDRQPGADRPARAPTGRPAAHDPGAESGRPRAEPAALDRLFVSGCREGRAVESVCARPASCPKYYCHSGPGAHTTPEKFPTGPIPRLGPAD